MSRETTLSILGIFVILAPFIGLPLSWLAFVLPVLGLFIAGIGISLRTQRKQSEPAATLEPVDTPAL